MTNIFSGQLYKNLVVDNNQLRLINYDVNRYQKTILQQADQGRREQTFREGLEYHQAFMGDLQTKLNEVTEKLNNLYRKYLNNTVAFRKPNQNPEYTGTSSALNGLPNVDSAPNTTGYPAGANGLLPYDDYDKIRNYSWNPWFGSKAIDESDNQVIRTNWQQPGTIYEQNYNENGAFWSAITYLWGWDVDRINATYATTDASGANNLQVNVTALNPNKPQYPPLAVGDRFQMVWSGNNSDGSVINTGGPTSATYPGILVDGIRPGGVDFSHATDSLDTGGDGAVGTSAHENIVGHDALNWGWEFDDLPMALEVTSVEKSPDGTVIPTGYRVVYDIPPTHPFYDDLKVLNGTEPMIIDAPTQIVKDRITNNGFDYEGFTYIPGVVSAETNYSIDGNHGTGGSPWKDNTAENELPPPKLYAGGTVTGETLAVSGGDGSGTNRYNLAPADRAKLAGGSSVQLIPSGINTNVTNVIYNSTTTTAFTGTGTIGSPIQVLDSQGFGNFITNEYVTFSNQPGSVYRITAVNSSPESFSVTLFTGPGANPPAPGAGDTVSLWGTDSTATTPKFTAAEVGVQVANPTAGQTGLKLPDVAGATSPILTMTLDSCNDVAITALTEVSMKYRFTVHQNYKQFGSPGDDNIPLPPQSHNNHDWASDAKPDFTGSSVTTGNYRYPLNTVDWSYTNAAPMGAGPVLLGESKLPANSAYDGWFVPPSFTGPEQVRAEIVDGPGANQATINVYFTGDLNGFHMEVADVQLVTYDGNLGSWKQGKYNAGNIPPIIQNGDPTVTAANDPDDVINKYIPGVYQFTQFNDQYNNQFTAADRNDIVRSPWEFAELKLGENSAVSGEVFLDLNSRRLNFDHAGLEATTTEGWAGSTVAVSNTGFSMTADGVANAHNFTNVVHPGDDCAPIYGSNESYQFSDSDPLSTAGHVSAELRNNTQDDEVLEGEVPQTQNSTVNPADPLRTANPAVDPPAAPATTNFYARNTTAAPTFTPVAESYTNGGNNDTTGTVDRIGASVDGATNAFNYNISIPTNDVNVLRKENNLLLNFGAIENRNYNINVTDFNMDVRTTPAYTSVPRYRVDAGGNIYDRFGTGFYNSALAGDVASESRVYQNANGASGNGQVSNFDDTYSSYNTTYNAGAGSFDAYITGHDRLSMSGDDYNLFDYVPDLNPVDASQPDGATFGEKFIGSLPSNFYYYREDLDVSNGELGTAPTSGQFNNDAKPALNFDGYRNNLSSTYDSPHTLVHNPNMPSWANVAMGAAQQDAKWFNTERTTTKVVWAGFPGLGSPLSYGQNIYATPAALAPDNVDFPELILGNNTGVAVFRESAVSDTGFGANADSSMVINMGNPVNNGGYLVINEINPDGSDNPHAVPLPLLDYETPPTPDPYPDYSAGTPSTYRFNSYGPETVTRTGSKYVSNFQDVLDALDGLRDGNIGSNATIQALLGGAQGGQFSTTDPPSTWGEGIILHVDSVDDFELEYPRSRVTLGTDPTVYKVVYKNDTNTPKTLYLEPDIGGVQPKYRPPNLIHADLQVQQITGEYQVTVVDDTGAPSVDGNNVLIEYQDNGTRVPGRLKSIGISSTSDKVGRIAGDDPRTTTVENNRIGPEVFDSPHGYVQPDAELSLSLVSQDDHGNQKPRKLRNVKVTVESGEQVIPSALVQTYSTDGPFSYADGTGDWPIALFDENVQINPETTANLNFMVGHFQGITAGSTASVLNVTSSAGFEEGQKVTINGETRFVIATTATTVTLDQPLSNVPLIGDSINAGNGLGTHELKMFLNRSFAMSMNAGVKVELEYEEFEPTGYPPTVDLTDGSGTIVTETIGFTDTAPKQDMFIAATNTGDGAGGGPLRVTIPNSPPQPLDYAANDSVNINGITRTIGTITNVGGNNYDLTFGAGEAPVRTELGQPLKAGIINQQDYENYLVAGTGRTGGSAENEFTKELKRIIDDPSYKELFRHKLFENIFISASVNDPFNDLIASKLFLNWDRTRKQVDITQTSFMAYFKSI